jgi:hypothetical protein
MEDGKKHMWQVRVRSLFCIYYSSPAGVFDSVTPNLKKKSLKIYFIII